jgi:predicted ArsR family transcriptional regulator
LSLDAVYTSFLYYVKYKLDLLQEFGLLAILKAKRYREYSLATNWDERFFESNRGRMVTLLRRSGRTVEELARALALTHNGVRAHLAILERDGIVRQRGSVRRGSGGGKPAYIYELTEEAEELFAKAYAPALGRLLDVLSEQLGSEESEALVRLVGRRLAGEHSTRVDGAHARLESAVEVFNELGGLAELEEHDGTHIIRGYACPLAAVTPDHPEVCRMAETLIAELAGVSVHERCDRSERPRCCFEVAAAGDTAQKK